MPPASPLTYHRAARPRRHSFFELHGETYRPAKRETSIGCGQSGSARRFETEDGRAPTMVVKKPHVINHESLNEGQKELAYYQKVYPGLDVHLDEDKQNGYRLIMPYLGEPLHRHYKKLTESYSVLNLCNRVINELKRIHELGVLHFDINTGNILVSERGKVTFIDGVTHRQDCTDFTPDVQTLTSIVSSLFEHLPVEGTHVQLALLQQGKKIKTLTDLKRVLESAVQGSVYTYNNPLQPSMFPTHFLGTGLSAPVTQHDISSTLRKQIASCKTTFSKNSSPLKPQALAVVTLVEEALERDEITESQAEDILTDTVTFALKSKPTLQETKQYLAKAQALDGMVKTTTRRLSKAMGLFALGLFVTALCVSSLGTGVAVGAGLAIFLALTTSLVTQKKEVQVGMETLGCNAIEGSGQRLLMKTSLRLS